VNKLKIDVNGRLSPVRIQAVRAGSDRQCKFHHWGRSADQLSGEPAAEAFKLFDYSGAPRRGFGWGQGPNRFFSLTNASVSLDNAIDLRQKEFGSSMPRCFIGGKRTVEASFTMFEQDKRQRRALPAARQQFTDRGDVPAWAAERAIIRARMKSVIPQVPEFDDSEGRLQWKFASSRAQGTVDDEISVAFG